ncbi:MAG: PA2169 family four-helix-bundle protein [Steroidobacteraceae bacterium]
MTRTQTAALLNDLIETSHDGEKGYAKAAREVADPSLKSLLVEGALRCREGARELEAEVRGMGYEPSRGGTLAGALHRGWISLRASSNSREAWSVLAECERGEDFAKARFAMALEEDLPEELREILSRQYEGVVANHDRVRSLRNRFPHPASARGL